MIALELIGSALKVQQCPNVGCFTAILYSFTEIENSKKKFHFIFKTILIWFWLFPIVFSRWVVDYNHKSNTKTSTS